jgi:hypothetical protein
MFYLIKPDEIKTAIARFTSYPTLWLDTEIANWQTPNPKLSLIQVLANSEDKKGDSVYLIDVLNKSESINYFIQQIIRNSAIEKVFHNASFDLKYLGGKEQSENITCTLKIAKNITRDRLGVPDLKLKTLAAELCNFKIEFNEQASNWEKRPLTPEQMQYATMDVVYLASVHRYLLEICDRKEKPIMKILDSLIKFFQEDDWNFSQDRSILEMGVSGKNGEWICLAQAIEEQKDFIFYSIYPKKIAKHRYLPIAEFLMRINELVNFGNFEMDLDDGEVRYKTSIRVKGHRLSHALIQPIVYRNITVMDIYIRAIEAVANGLSPQEVMTKLRG